MKIRILRLLLTLMLLTALLPFPSAQAQPHQQVTDPAQKARLLLARMQPAERIGQLFLVGFKGRDVTSKNVKILDLVNNYHIGGIVLRSANDNFTGPQGSAEETLRMVTELQNNRYASAQKAIRNPVTGFTYTPQYIPLFISASQEGDLYPNDQLWNGITPLPSEMALGATWKPTTAEKIGNVLGFELQALGINLLLGPSLDVLETPRPEISEDQGTRSFGGDAFWVGEMGAAFIRGVHQGSGKHVAVIAKNFPGRGNADRSPEDEIATVPGSQDQLKSTELLPFFEVAGNAQNPESVSDGFLVSHIRYSGFQGTIRSTTRPISLDGSAMEQILSLPGLTSWRQAGGVLVSDNLGGSGLRRFYDPTGQAFDARQVARDAILGGNDLLITDTNFIASGDADSYATLVRTLDFLTQKYREDQAFAQRVDAAVVRLLTLKYKLYPDFTLANVVSKEDSLAQVGRSQQVTFDAASQAVTLISPKPAELRTSLPRPPAVGERIVFITDLTSARQCGQCPEQAPLPVDALANAAVRLYGPRAGGQINQANLTSFSTMDLKNLLDNSKDKLPQLEDDLKLAEWVVFGIQKVQSSRTESQALRRLLTQRPDLTRNKRIIVFAFNAPYYLDATDIALVTAYYALYGKSTSFVEVAVRVLFQELPATGAAPVSVPGAGYDLKTALLPEPTQVIPLEIELPQPVLTPQPTQQRTTVTPSATPTVMPTVKVGETLTLKTGVIYDHNHNPVPDGTQVKFLFTSGSSEGGLVQQVTASTLAGIARTTYRIQNTGTLEIRVVSEPATLSRLLRLNISATGAVAITALTPTPQPSETPRPSATATITPSPTPSPSPAPPPLPYPGAGQWFISILAILAGATGAFFLGRAVGLLRWGVRWAFTAALGGFFMYTYIALGMPGSSDFVRTYGSWGVVWLTVLGMLLGWLAGWGWRRWLQSKARMLPAAKTSSANERGKQ